MKKIELTDEELDLVYRCIETQMDPSCWDDLEDYNYEVDVEPLLKSVLDKLE